LDQSLLQPEGRLGWVGQFALAFDTTSWTSSGSWGFLCYAYEWNGCDTGVRTDDDKVHFVVFLRLLCGLGLPFWFVLFWPES
jgi:hypothetical protein